MLNILIIIQIRFSYGIKFNFLESAVLWYSKKFLAVIWIFEGYHSLCVYMRVAIRFRFAWTLLVFNRVYRCSKKTFRDGEMWNYVLDTKTPNSFSLTLRKQNCNKWLLWQLSPWISVTFLFIILLFLSLINITSLVNPVFNIFMHLILFFIVIWPSWLTVQWRLHK